MEKQKQNLLTTLQPGVKARDQQEERVVRRVKEEKWMCEECSFQISVGLTQQILELRQKIAFFQKQISEVQRISELDQSGVAQLIRPLQSGLYDQYSEQNSVENQIHFLQNQLSTREGQLQQQQSQFQAVLQKEEKVQAEWQRLEHQMDQKQLQYRFQTESVLLTLKQTQINRALGILDKTNFISILYSITFDNESSFLNGEKVTFENLWKVVEILFFYQTKYTDYHPLYHIFWSEMKLQTDRDLRQINLLGKSQNSLLRSFSLSSEKLFQKQIYMDFSSEQDVLDKWMPYLLLQIKNFFFFLNVQAGHNSKLKYPINDKGQFQVLIDKKFDNQHQRFNRTIRCLLTDIDQINKIEFFARQKRIKSQ